MAMVINTNVQAIRTHGVYNYNSSAMNEAMTRVATGQKINSAKDNASTWAITQRMRDRIRANDQANQNVQNDSALLRTAQGGIGNTVSILTTLKERAINAANDSNVNLDRDAIAIEVKQLVQQIDDNASKVKFNGRYLLNGSADPTETASEAVEESTIVDPKVASMPAATDTTRGSHAVYKLDSLVKANGTATAAVADTDKLTNLLKSGTTTVDPADAKATNAGFKIGDTITFSWKEDGKENSYTYEYTNAADTLEKLAFDKGALSVKWVAASTALTSKDNSNIKFDHDGKPSTAVVESNKVFNSASTPAQVTSGTVAGLYAIGDLGVKITDFKVSVTYADFNNDDKETTRVDAQDALLFTGVQQVKEATAEPTYSASAVKFADVSYDVGTTDTLPTADTTIMQLKFGGTAGITNGQYSDYITFKWGDNEADQITMRGNNTLGELQQALADRRKSVSLNLVTAANQELKDANGNFVTKDADGQNYKTTVPSGATKMDLYFVSKTGETLDPLQFTVSATDADGNTKGVAATVKATSALEVAQEEEVVEEPKELTIAESSPLTFHVGGEADFAIDVTINKMTVDNLFAERNDYGNVTKIYDDSTFSDLFKTKEGATQAISIIDTALNTALAEQTKLGAIEARLGYTSDNLTTMNENLEAANSAFRDSDIAKEMTNYMKYSVLSQASQYMLAQAGQNSFSVLNLLQQ